MVADGVLHRGRNGFAGEFGHTYHTKDGGETWDLIAGEVPGDRYTWTTPETPADEAMVRVLVFDRDGLLGFDTSDEAFILTSGTSSVEHVIPVVYGLAQNFPNPFNPQTEIRYDLPHPGKTHLVVYDIRGRKVIDLVNEHMDAGRHSVVWTGKDGSGRSVASGVRPAVSTTTRGWESSAILCSASASSHRSDRRSASAR